MTDASRTLCFKVKRKSLLSPLDAIDVAAADTPYGCSHARCRAALNSVLPLFRCKLDTVDITEAGGDRRRTRIPREIRQVDCAPKLRQSEFGHSSAKGERDVRKAETEVGAVGQQSSGSAPWSR